MIMTALVNSRHGLGLDVMCLKDAYSLELFNVTCSLKLFHNVRAAGKYKYSCSFFLIFLDMLSYQLSLDHPLEAASLQIT